MARIFFPAVLSLPLFFPSAVLACSVCMKGATPDAQRAYFWGILMLLCLPFILFSIIGSKIFLSIRKKAQGSGSGSHAV